MPLLHAPVLPLVLALSAIPEARAYECPPLTPDITIPVPESAPDAWAFIQFGHAIARSGDRVIVGGVEGGLEGTGFGKGPGFATVFTVDGSTWTVEALRLAASNGAVDDAFGASVAMDGTVAVIGAPRRTVGATQRAGTAFIFTRSGSTWSEAQMLTAPSPQAAATFGRTVALSRNLLAIGAPYENDGSTQDAGAVHVFRLESGTWTHRKRLTAPSPQMHDFFATSIALDGTSLVAGCPGKENGSVSSAGAVFVYDLSDSDPAAWTLLDTLVAPDPLENQQMGAAVAILDDVIAAGAPLDSIGSGACQAGGIGTPAFGAVHVFRRDGGSAVHEQRLTLPPPACDGIRQFGATLALASGRVLIGAVEDGIAGVAVGYDAFVFDHTPTGWTMARRLQRPTDGGGVNALFGSAAIFMGNATAVVGARNYLEFSNTIYEGRVFAFDVEITDCNGNGLDDCVEISACLVADCNGNGIPDCCDIAAETSEDANNNGIPDECDALLDCGGSLADCTVNGMPDECERSGLFDVIFVLDESASVVDGNPPTFDLQKDAVRAAICGLGALDAFAAIASLRAKRLPEHAQQTPMGAGVHATPLRACRWVPVIRRTSSGVCTRRIPGQVLRTSGDDGAPDALREKARPGSPTREGGLQGGASAPLRMRVQRATACTAQCPGASSSSLTRACTRARARSPARCRSRQAADLECPDHSILRQGARAQGGLRPPLQPPCAHEGGGGQPACEWWCLRASGRAEQVGLVKRSPPSAPAIRADWWSTARTSRNSTLPCAAPSSRTCSAAPACLWISATTTPPGSGTATATASRTASSDTGTTPRTWPHASRR